MRYKVVPNTTTSEAEAEGEVFLRLSYREFDLLSAVVSGSTSSVGCSNFWTSFREAAAQRWGVTGREFRESETGPGALRRYILARREWRAELMGTEGRRIVPRLRRVT
jgi:hypothetical protein